jgi:hypothetical protein
MVSTEVVQYEDAYRLCYIRGPEGLLIGIAEELHPATEHGYSDARDVLDEMASE